MDKTNSLVEVLDVVDENDEIIGQAPRHVVHGNPPLKHREIGILVHDADNQILIQQRSKKKITRPSMWTLSVAGHVKAGWLPLEGAQQELAEELGLSGEPIFAYKEYLEYEMDNKFLYRYTCKYSGQEIKFEREEVEQVKFVTAEEFEQMIELGESVSPQTIKFLREFWKSK